MTETAGQLRDVIVHHVGTLRRSIGGHPYVEAETSEGVAAFWGLGDELSNINAMLAAALPASVRCQVRNPQQGGRHSIWIPWSSPLFVSKYEPAPRTADSATPFDAEAARDELSRLGRVLGSLLDQSEGHPSSEGLVPRILRLSKANVVPRRVSALMIFVAEFRNSAEHDREPFTAVQTAAARGAWRAITEWLETVKPEAQGSEMAI